MYRGWTQTDYQNKHYNINQKRRRNIGRPKKRWKWLQHVQRMDTNRLPKQALQYKPKKKKEHRTTEEEMEVATTCTVDGHKQTTKSGYNMYRGWTQTDYQKWLQHVQRMDTDRLPKQALEYKPKGRRNIGQQRKR